MFRISLATAFLLALAPLLVPFDSGPSIGTDHSPSVTISPEAPTDSDVLTVATRMVFANSCCTLRGYRVRVDHEKRRVKVRLKYATTKGGCLDALWQITEDVSVGPLTAGSWTVDTRFRLNGKKAFQTEQEVVVLEAE